MWMWATVNHLPDAQWLMQQLGAQYVTNAVWVKATDHGEKTVRFNDLDEGMFRVIQPQAPGLGQRLRCCHEHLLFGRIGRVPVPPPADRMPSVIYAPKTKHSAKPQAAFDVIARHDQHHTFLGQKLELFAREPRDGYVVWGNEVDDG